MIDQRGDAWQGGLQYHYHQDDQDQHQNNQRGNAWQGKLQLRGHCGLRPPQLLGTRSCKSQDDDDGVDDLMMIMMMMLITLVGRSSKLASPPVKLSLVRAAH